MNQLYNQVSGHIVGYIGFITNNMANYLNAVAEIGRSKLFHYLLYLFLITYLIDYK